MVFLQKTHVLVVAMLDFINLESGVIMHDKKIRFNLSLYPKEKDFIQNKSNEYGYKNVSSFILNSAENFFMIDVDLSHFDKVAKEINYIGNNINNLVHHIFTVGVYSDYDLKEIQRLQKEIFKRLDKEYDYLLKLRRKYKESNMSLKDKKKLIEELKKHEIDIPKEVLLKEIYEKIRNNVLYICKLIEDSPEQEDGISDYVYEYLFDGNLFDLDEKKLIQFADDIFIFSEKMKMKLLNVMNIFEDEDWYDLKDILDKYEDL